MEQIGASAEATIRTLTILSSSEAEAEERREYERSLAVYRAALPSALRGKRWEDFDPNPDHEALERAREFADVCANWFEAGRPTEPPGPVVFFTSRRPGEEIAPGNGKTLLGGIILNDLAERGHLRIYTHERTGAQWPNLVFVSVTDLLDEIRACYGRGAERTVDEVIGRYLAADVLQLDDVGTESDSDDSTAKLFTLLEKRKRPIIITSNYTTKQLAKRRVEWAKLVSRIRERMLGAVLTGPDRREPKADPWATWRK